MFVYGVHAVTQFIESYPERCIEIWVLKNQTSHKQVIALANSAGITVQPVDKSKLDNMIEGVHQGLVLKIKPLPLGDEKSLQAWLKKDLPENALILVLDGIQDPHNLGACLRSAAAFGVHAVVWPKDNQASITPVVRKVAAGAVEVLNIFVVTNLVRAMILMKEAGVWMVGTLVDEHAKPMRLMDLKGPTGIVMGAEGTGLREGTQKACDFTAFIPMPGSMESLNVSVATGICLYEATRQRKE